MTESEATDLDRPSSSSISIRWGNRRISYPCDRLTRTFVRRIYREERQLQQHAPGSGFSVGRDRMTAADKAAHFLLVAGSRPEGSTSDGAPA